MEKKPKLRLSSAALLTPSCNSEWQIVRPEHFQLVSPPPDWDDRLQELQDRIGLQFRNVTHLKCAMTHHGRLRSPRTLPNDVPVHRLSNRSLAFLGDALLDMCAASYLFQVQTQHKEGKLTLGKMALVNNTTLSKICVRDLQLHDIILVSSDYSLQVKNVTPAYTKGRTTIQSGAVESLIAAVYLDQVRWMAECSPMAGPD